MNWIVYFLADLYPWWGLPIAFITGEQANYYRRHGNRTKMIIFAGISLLFLTLALLYFMFNGVEKLRPAMQQIERNYLKK